MLKKLEGNPGKRPLNQNEPDPPRGEVPLAAGLASDPQVVREFRRICSIICRDMNVGRPADMLAIQILTVDSILLTRIQKRLLKGPSIEKGKSGLSHTHPLHSILEMISRRILMVSREFGLTPSSRANLTTVEVGAGSPAPNGPDRSVKESPWDKLEEMRRAGLIQ